ncbi:hypothetical protein CTAYLR_001863 [Chrysophaeum taylorii]|uniref:MYND-type domain-containing protein n=1 Tax=Chrysophaeum taylorii TaxID=2483200 RepID=A0AAD7U8D2_9STRA|nr:hypothetical protein CTAYLR_001863 [Chrysophaeum taylorii]
MATETMEFAANRSVRDLTNALSAMGIVETNGRSKAWMIKAYADDAIQLDGKIDPTASGRTHEKNCNGCEMCKQRRREFKQREKERRREACEHCGQTATEPCSKRKLSSFCSRECMQAGWPAHKTTCKLRVDRDVSIVGLLGTMTDHEYAVHYAYAAESLDDPTTPRHIFNTVPATSTRAAA